MNRAPVLHIQGKRLSGRGQEVERTVIYGTSSGARVPQLGSVPASSEAGGKLHDLSVLV